MTAFLATISLLLALGAAEGRNGSLVLDLGLGYRSPSNFHRRMLLYRYANFRIEGSVRTMG